MSVDFDVVDALAGFAEDLHSEGNFAMRLHDAVKRLKEERDEARAERGELLAIIHRDGGHYVGQHGLTKAVADAHATWAAVVRERDEARAEVERLRVQRDDSDAEAHLANARLAEIVELVGEGGDGTAFGSVESLLATFKELEEGWVRKHDAAFRRGAEAMREAAAACVEKEIDLLMLRAGLAADIRDLPVPEDR